MKPKIKSAFQAEMGEARAAYADKDYDTAFYRLERAHILGQRYFITHWVTHWWMLKVGLRRWDWREIRGQITRIIAVIPGYLFGWVPKGNTGGANVSATEPMPIPPDLAEPLKGYSVWRDVVLRMLMWVSLAAIVWAVFFARTVWDSAGENRVVVSQFSGVCSKLIGFPGAEDIILDTEQHTAYAVGGDRRSFRSGGPGRAKIWAIPFDNPEAATRADLSPPNPETFRSFGMDLHIDDTGVRRLLVANRGSRHSVEIFREDKNGTLVHERSLVAPLLKNPNDLVAIGPDAALVTLDKEADAGTLKELLDGAMRRRTGKVLYIDANESRLVADNLMMANGITLSADGDKLYVGELVGQSIAIFDRDMETNTLAFNRAVAVGTGVDNLSLGADGKVYAAGHPKLLSLAIGYQNSEDQLSPSEVVAIDPLTDSVERIYINDGSEHAGSSVAVVDSATGRMLIGSAFGPHILNCQFEPSRDA